ncbi:nitroreductase family deazaflavin-dependent oxidoreductase [Nonomuraea sp. NN258]|uniref:nitroreductase/quinone reductase family protein n=1 Tax=Nonomuraea antri TaxID=2730852 RepID=UPI00156A2E02|nr:nitroreductase/quinone reductase family protein [Nonomuraea antri]NRQ30866.1 nitroreductase family deazaflavin-dependent oxidoreductase [Nonomuraea antri]
MDFTQHVIEEFRAGHGQVGGRFEGTRLLLLTTTDAASGEPRTTALAYLPDGVERMLVISEAAQAPAWYHDLRAEPQATVETGVLVFDVEAEVLAGAERDAVLARAAEGDPDRADYRDDHRAGTTPVVALRVTGPPRDNAPSGGAYLKLVHDGFRRELALIRKELSDSGRPGLGAQLRINCLTVCQGLHHHHTGEDVMLFPDLAERHPALAPTLRRLAEEHERITVLLDELRQALSGDDPLKVRAEVERLVDELEAHLTYEEEQLIPVLDLA